MKDQTWQQRIDAAHEEHDVVEVVREYLATLSHDEFAELPEPLRPRKVVDAADVATYALELARHECEDQDKLQLVQRITQMMSRASVRLAEILAAASGGDERAA
jgi:hypothetical protein